MIIVRDASLRRRALVAVACLLALQGCRGNQSHEGGDDEEEHHGHVIPAHKPRTFPDAVRRLRELNAKIRPSVSGGTAGGEQGDQSLKFAVDIANWLPEIAADSDMPEEPWNRVNALAPIIATDYQRLSEAQARERPAEQAALLKDAKSKVSDLGTVLAGSNPKWFVVKVRESPAAEPESESDTRAGR